MIQKPLKGTTLFLAMLSVGLIIAVFPILQLTYQYVGQIWIFQWWLTNLLSYLVLMTTEVLIRQWTWVKRLKIMLWEHKEFLFVWENRIQCLNITFQIWLSVVNTIHDYHSKFYIFYSQYHPTYYSKFYNFHTSGFDGQSSSIHLPSCETKVTNKESDQVHWQQR